MLLQESKKDALQHSLRSTRPLLNWDETTNTFDTIVSAKQQKIKERHTIGENGNSTIPDWLPSLHELRSRSETRCSIVWLAPRTSLERLPWGWGSGIMSTFTLSIATHSWTVASKKMSWANSNLSLECRRKSTASYTSSESVKGLYRAKLWIICSAWFLDILSLPDLNLNPTSAKYLFAREWLQ